ncbi:ATP synthase F1 subunit gamma [Sporanaerobium hydrogeniformans]|uniref:ATP synthase F1 subunit gamma n=1 Tax=Sporanaerobium hydrogeniformans TaxID=3072179 RepID=A0AC61DB88_9FIRM|nr:ATP synthase F1 subunit gamma [Sporanaerobium hydrogeniformans]PHV69857.1 ATP synthase F1 subunit gamma [Sporanaerobium hydrogeniformans]
MASLQDIKGRIRSIDSTKKITSAMNLVATSKLNKSKEAALKTRPFFNKILTTMQSIAQNAKGTGSPFLRANGSDVKAYITLTGDKGLCGGYNANICKLTMNAIESKAKTHLVVVGKKGVDQFKSRGFEVNKALLDISESPAYSDAKEIANYVIDKFKKGEIGEVYLAYTSFKSSIQQEPQMVKILPLDMKNIEEQISESEQPSDLLVYEPSPEAVLGYIIPRYVADVIYGGLVEASASENGARMTAMDSATENATEIMDKLSIQYNRARQAAITQELTEIVAGAEALK